MSPPPSSWTETASEDLSQFTGLYYREFVKTFRSPWVLAVLVAQPFMWLAFFGSSLAGASCTAVLIPFFGTCNYIEFLLPGVLSTSMLTIGMFGSMSMIQDKRFGYLKRILITPARRTTVFLAKALGATSRGLIQFPVMVVAASFFGVTYGNISPVMWLGWFFGVFLLGLGFSAVYLIITARSTDWQTPGVLSNFITMPLMFSSTALFPSANFPWWMQDISKVNPVTYSTLFGRDIILTGVAHWDYLGALALFAVLMLVIGMVVYSRWLRVE